MNGTRGLERKRKYGSAFPILWRNHFVYISLLLLRAVCFAGTNNEGNDMVQIPASSLMSSSAPVAGVGGKSADVVRENDSAARFNADKVYAVCELKHAGVMFGGMAIGGAIAFKSNDYPFPTYIMIGTAGALIGGLVGIVVGNIFLDECKRSQASVSTGTVTQ